MAKLTWLHLSDWHQGAEDFNPLLKGENFDRIVVRDKLLDDLKERRKRIAPAIETIDFVVFSGDAAFSGTANQFTAARKILLSPVLAALGVPNERLFVVPGNHDIAESQFKFLGPDLNHPFSSQAETQKWLRPRKERREVLKPFAAYKTFANAFARPGQGDRAYAGVYEFVMPGKQKIALLGLNSALMSRRNHDTAGEVQDKGYLVVGEPQIHDALRTIASADIRIAIVHHPFEWLAEFDRYRIEASLGHGCHFILCGHEHVPRVLQFQGTQGSCVIIPAGAGFDRRTPSDPRYTNAYNIVQLDLASGHGTVYLRRWEDQRNGQGEWLPDTATYANGQVDFSLANWAPRANLPVGSRLVNPTPPVCVLRPATHCPLSTLDEALQQYSTTNVYLNIPYNESFAKIEIAIWLVLKLHGLDPVLAREREDNRDRLCRITHLIWQCKFGISDFSWVSGNVSMEDMAMRQNGVDIIEMTGLYEEFKDEVSNLLPVDVVEHQFDPETLVELLSKRVQNSWHPPRRLSSQERHEAYKLCYEPLVEMYQKRGYAFISSFYSVAEGLLPELWARIKEASPNGEA